MVFTQNKLLFIWQIVAVFHVEKLSACNLWHSLAVHYQGYVLCVMQFARINFTRSPCSRTNFCLSAINPMHIMNVCMYVGVATILWHQNIKPEFFSSKNSDFSFENCSKFNPQQCHGLTASLKFFDVTNASISGQNVSINWCWCLL